MSSYIFSYNIEHPHTHPGNTFSMYVSWEGEAAFGLLTLYIERLS
jgi:hypothetical protein